MKADALIASAEISRPTEEAERPALLKVDAENFRHNFNRRPFTFRHHLADHPLFAVQQLVALARSLPADHVKYSGGDMPVSQGLYQGPPTGLSIEETIRRIEECNSWMVLKWIEKEPAYREVLDYCLDEIQHFTEPLDPGMFKREGFIFVSSPSAITPYHMDPEYNFLLQIRGHKTIHMFDGWDRSILSEEELEEYMASGSERMPSFKDEYETKSSIFELTPGVGLHFPVTAPHWVQNGDQVSISFSVTFRTPALERRSVTYDVNSRLRRLGFQPVPFGRSRLRDAAKYQIYRALRRGRSLVTGSRPQPSRQY